MPTRVRSDTRNAIPVGLTSAAATAENLDGNLTAALGVGRAPTAARSRAGLTGRARSCSQSRQRRRSSLVRRERNDSAAPAAPAPRPTPPPRAEEPARHRRLAPRPDAAAAGEGRTPAPAPRHHDGQPRRRNTPDRPTCPLPHRSPEQVRAKRPTWTPAGRATEDAASQIPTRPDPARRTTCRTVRGRRKAGLWTPTDLGVVEGHWETRGDDAERNRGRARRPHDGERTGGRGRGPRGSRSHRGGDRHDVAHDHRVTGDSLSTSALPAKATGRTRSGSGRWWGQAAERMFCPQQ